MKKSRYSHAFLSAFVYATRGWLLSVRQRNMRIHLAVALIVIGTGVFFSLQPWEWIAVVLAIGLVLMAELFNTAIEFLCDEVTTEHRMGIGHSKDIASGAVLAAVLVSVVIGLLVFVPYLSRLCCTSVVSI